MFDLEVALVSWRDAMDRQRGLSGETVDELEDHLREMVARRIDAGELPADAFQRACAELGAPRELAAEFAKIPAPPWRRWLSLGWLLFAAAFFLPAHRYGLTIFDVRLGDGALPGIQAFLVALKGEAGFIGVLSALTNIAMLGTFWTWRLGRRAALVTSVVLLVASVLNGWWLVAVDVADLQIGYYLWWFSYVLAGGALAQRAVESRRIAVSA